MANEKAPLDPTTDDRRILACSKCHEPVVASGFSGRVILKCGYCGHEEERALSTTKNEGGGYREKPNALAKKVSFDLALALPKKKKVGEAIDAARLRSALARRPADDADVLALEWERVWIAVWLALRNAMDGDKLAARVTLETALEGVTFPAYRALLLAHLAQHAAAQKAVPLAEKWLKAAPEVTIAEVEAELRIARAMIDLAEDDLDAVLEKTGGDVAGAGYAGQAVWLAIALHMEALQRKGDPQAAALVLESVRRKKQEALVLVPMIAFRLGVGALAKVDQRARVKDALTSASIVAGGSGLVALLAKHPIALTAILLTVAAASVTSALVSWLTWRLASNDRQRQIVWLLSRWLIPALFLALSAVRLAAGR